MLELAISTEMRSREFLPAAPPMQNIVGQEGSLKGIRTAPALPVKTVEIPRLRRNIQEEVLEQANRDLQNYPTSFRAYLTRGMLQAGYGLNDLALKDFLHALALKPSSSLARLKVAYAYLDMELLDEAESHFSELQHAHQLNSESLIGLAVIALKRGNRSEALELYKWGWERFQGESESCYALGKIALQADEPRLALDAMRRAVHLNGTTAVYHCALGQTYFALGELVKACSAFRQAMELLPNMPDAVKGLSNSLIRLGDESGAIQQLRYLLRNNPDDAESHELAAWAMFQQGKPKDARGHIFHALRIAGNISVHDRSGLARLQNNLGVCQWQLRQTDEAFMAFMRSIENEPESSAPFLNLGRFWLDRRNFTKASKVLDKCRARFPMDDDCIRLYAISSLGLGNVERSVDMLLEGVKPSHKPSAETYGMLGAVLADELRNISWGIQMLEKGLSVYPHDVMLKNNLAYALLLNNRTTEAEAVLRSINVAERMTGNLSIVLPATHGLLALKHGSVEEAIRRYGDAEREARRKGRTDMARTAIQKLHLELAKHYLGLGELGKALLEIEEGRVIDGYPGYRRDLDELYAQLSIVSLPVA